MAALPPSGGPGTPEDRRELLRLLGWFLVMALVGVSMLVLSIWVDWH